MSKIVVRSFSDAAHNVSHAQRVIIGDDDVPVGADWEAAGLIEEYSGEGVDPDATLSSTSVNSVQNKVVRNATDNLQGAIDRVRLLIGVVDPATTLGAFVGDLIDDGQTIKAALQQIENALNQFAPGYGTTVFTSITPAVNGAIPTPSEAIRVGGELYSFTATVIVGTAHRQVEVIVDLVAQTLEFVALAADELLKPVRVELSWITLS